MRGLLFSLHWVGKLPLLSQASDSIPARAELELPLLSQACLLQIGRFSHEGSTVFTTLGWEVASAIAGLRFYPGTCRVRIAAAVAGLFASDREIFP